MEGLGTNQARQGPTIAPVQGHGHPPSSDNMRPEQDATHMLKQHGCMAVGHRVSVCPVLAVVVCGVGSWPDAKP